jgi:hypothetical protein
MPATHVSAPAVYRDGKLHLMDPVVFNAGLKRLKPGEGETFVITVTPEADAIWLGQYRYFFAAIVTPLSEYTGYPKAWVHEFLKALFYPKDGRTSLTQLSRQEFADYISTCEEFARVEFWDAFDDAEQLAA